MADAVAILNDKIAVLPESYVDDVLQFIDFLQYKDGQSEADNVSGEWCRTPGIMK